MDKKPIVAILVAGAVLFAAGYWSADGRNGLVEPAAAQSGPARAVDPDSRHRAFCQDLSGWRLGFAETFVTIDLDLSAQQIELFGAVADRLRETAARPDGICDRSEWRLESTDLPAAIASARAWIAAAQNALDDIEPPLIAFYGSLDDVQRNRLSMWMSEGQRRHGR